MTTSVQLSAQLINALADLITAGTATTEQIAIYTKGLQLLQAGTDFQAVAAGMMSDSVTALNAATTANSASEAAAVTALQTAQTNSVTAVNAASTAMTNTAAGFTASTNILMSERSDLSNKRDLIIASTPMTCLHRDIANAEPVSTYAYAAQYAQYSCSWRSDSKNLLFIAMQANPYTVQAVDLTTGVGTVDSQSKCFIYITEDASGTVWANCASAGYYGLWKRTGTAAWTQVIVDTNQGMIARGSDDVIYYRTYGASWYILSGGTATTTADPYPSSYGWMYSSNYCRNNDNVGNYALLASPGCWTNFGILPAVAGYGASSPEQTGTRYWPPFAMSNGGGTKIAPLGDINWDLLAECTQGNGFNQNSDIQQLGNGGHKFHRLDSTYMLHTISMQINGQASTVRRPDAGSRKIAMAILNKTTGVSRYIGSLYLTGNSAQGISATAASTQWGQVVGARMVAGVLDLWIAQGTGTTTGTISTDYYGLFKKSLTLNLTF